jgi:hypothetical protein
MLKDFAVLAAIGGDKVLFEKATSEKQLGNRTGRAVFDAADVKKMRNGVCR